MHSKSLFFSFLFCSLVFMVSVNLKAQPPSTGRPSNWSKGPSNRFVGNVWVEYFVSDSLNDFLASKVFFEPNARSNWHRHLGRQIIFGIDGEGYYKEKGKPIRIVKKGDVVVIEPGTIHSHGSVYSKTFTQAVMMNDISKKDATTWLAGVTEEELKEYK